MLRKSLFFVSCLALSLLLWISPCLAHFGTLIPSDDIVTQEDPKEIRIDVKFMHPMEMNYMNMVKPEQFGVMVQGRKIDLIGSLKEANIKGAHQDRSFLYWIGSYRIKRPGDYTFYVVPKPYWEPAEDKFIVHYTKVCVNALGLESGWDQPLDLETEIVPLSRPYGLWSGNVFSGQVLLKGKPVPFAELEVEYMNGSDSSHTIIVPPSDPYVTQVIKADAQGVFNYAMPRAGWWGFAALSEASWKLNHDGQDKPVEIGAVYWVRTRDMR